MNTHPTDRSSLRSQCKRPVLSLCALLLAGSMAPAGAQPEPGPELSVAADDAPTLKAAYLDCDRHASERLLAHGEILRCSLVSEALLVRVFKGDFSQLMAWWNAEKAQRSITRAARVGGDPGSTP